MKKLPALLAVVLLEWVALGQTSTPKTTYILAGRLFDATSEKVRENAVITTREIASPPGPMPTAPSPAVIRAGKCGVVSNWGRSRPVA